MKGLLVYTLTHRDRSDCTNNGLTSKFDKFILIGEGVQGPFDPNKDIPELKLVRRNIFGKPYVHAEPVERAEGVGWMFGGNYITTSDSRFPNTYPIPVHDRQETLKQYEQLNQ